MAERDFCYFCHEELHSRVRKYPRETQRRRCVACGRYVCDMDYLSGLCRIDFALLNPRNKKRVGRIYYWSLGVLIFGLILPIYYFTMPLIGTYPPTYPISLESSLILFGIIGAAVVLRYYLVRYAIRRITQATTSLPNTSEILDGGDERKT